MPEPEQEHGLKGKCGPILLAGIASVICLGVAKNSPIANSQIADKFWRIQFCDTQVGQ